MSEVEPHYASVPPDQLPHLPRHPIRVVIDNLRSAYNVGSVFRTSDAAAVEHLYLCGVSPHPPNDKLDKTALGAFDYVPWSYHRQAEEVVRELHRQGLAVVAVENTPDAVSYCRFHWPRPSVLVLGHEVEGISREVLAMCDHRVLIPVQGLKRTLNVATAYGIVLFEILRQWEAL